MQEKKRPLVILCALVSFFLPVRHGWAGGGFVGNGGNGVELGERLFVEDLVLLDIYEHPFFGSRTDSALPPLPSRSAVAFDYPRDLLARKLTDINRACPGIGDYILASIKRYNWLLEDFPLVPIPDPQNPVVLPPGSTVVQIANRFGSTIRIHAGSWARLDDENKIALMIHEAVYSLVRLQRANDDGGLYQPPYAAREVTGQFFRAAYLSQPFPVLYAALRDKISIPYAPLSLAQIRTPSRWTLQYGKFTRDEKENHSGYKPTGAVHVAFPDPPDENALNQPLRRVCHEIARQGGSKDMWINSLFVPRPVKVIMEEYHVSKSDPVSQGYVEVESQGSETHAAWVDDVSASSCENALADEIRWIAGEEN